MFIEKFYPEPKPVLTTELRSYGKVHLYPNGKIAICEFTNGTAYTVLYLSDGKKSMVNWYDANGHETFCIYFNYIAENYGDPITKVKAIQTNCTTNAQTEVIFPYVET